MLHSPFRRGGGEGYTGALMPVYQLDNNQNYANFSATYRSISALTQRPMASAAVNPGDSIPSRFTNPGSP